MNIRGVVYTAVVFEPQVCAQWGRLQKSARPAQQLARLFDGPGHLNIKYLAYALIYNNPLFCAGGLRLYECYGVVPTRLGGRRYGDGVADGERLIGFDVGLGGIKVNPISGIGFAANGCKVRRVCSVCTEYGAL